MVRSALKSAGLHALALLFAYLGVPQLLAETPPAESVVVVDLVPIAEVRNLPSTMPAPEPELAPAPPPEPPAPPAPEPEAAPLAEPEPAPAPEPEPAPLAAPAQVAEPEPEPEPEVVEAPRLPEEITRPRKKPKPPPSLDFEEALKSLEDLAPSPARAPAPAPDPIEQLLAEADTPYRMDAPLSMTEIDAIKAQIQRNWNVPAGARDAHTMVVTLRLKLGPDGTVEHVEVVEAARMRNDAFFRTMAESAVRAVLKTGRILYLSPEKYSRWRDIKLTFNPAEMFS